MECRLAARSPVGAHTRRGRAPTGNRADAAGQWQLYYYRSGAWANALSTDTSASAPRARSARLSSAAASIPDGVRLQLTLPPGGALSGVSPRSSPSRFLDVMLGFAAGVILAASYWSLLAPAIAMSESLGNMAWLPAAVGFVSGAIFLRLVDVFLPTSTLPFRG